MEYSKLVKPIEVPADFKPPESLRYKHLVATPLNREDVKEDLEAVNSSRNTIIRTRGGNWPEEELSEEFNWLDIVWHEREFRDNSSFAYAVRNDQGEYIGCFYLYPVGLRQNLSKELMVYNVDVSWWTTDEAHERGDYKTLYLGLKEWLKDEFKVIGRPWFSNIEIPQTQEFQ